MEPANPRYPAGQPVTIPGRAGPGARRQATRSGAAPSATGYVPPPEDPSGPSGDPLGDPESVAKSICLRLLTTQARSRADLAAALSRRGIPDEVIGRVLDRFTQVGLIDDAAYAQAFVASKQRGRGLGRSALRIELRRKGIEGAIAEDALRAVDAESERRRAAELVSKRLDSAVLAGLPAARRRLLGLLARRGYAAGLAVAVVNEALRGFGEDTELPLEQESDVAAWESDLPQ